MEIQPSDREIKERAVRGVTHHLQTCSQCQNYIVKILEDAPGVLAGTIWCHLRAHSLDNQSRGLL